MDKFLGYYKKFVYILVAIIAVVNVFRSYILQLVCYFNVIFIMAPSNNKRKLPTNNQNLERDSLTPLYINLPKLNGSLKTFEKLKYMSFTLEQKHKKYI